MKLQIDRNPLNLAVNRLQGAISDRMLSQIGLKAENNLLHLNATDRIIAIYNSFDCDVKNTGTVFVPGRLFSDVVKQLPEGNVTLEVEQNFLKIIAGAKDEFLMKLPLVEDMTWKDPPKIDVKNSLEIEASKLRYMIEQVQFCIEQESPRNYGAIGFWHKVQKGKLRLVGTDGFRLSYCDISVEVGEDFLDTGVCLSKRTLSEIYRMASEGFERIGVAVSKDNTTIVTSAPNYQIFARLSAVKYPNYQGVLPTANLRPVKLSRTNFQNVARRVLLAADKTQALQLSFSDSSLTLKSKTAGTSEGKESIFLRDFKGEEKDLHVNGKFLTEVFAVIPTDDVTLQFRSEQDPIVITPCEEPSGCYSMHVLVPISENQ